MTDGSQKRPDNPGLVPEEGGLDDLRSRLDALQHSVESLGAEGEHPASPGAQVRPEQPVAPQEPGPGYQPPVGQQRPATYEQPPSPGEAPLAQGAAAPEPAPTQYAPPQPTGDPYAQSPYSVPEYPAAAYAQEPAGHYEPEPESYEPAPAATNGGRHDPEREILTTSSATIAIVDAGPFGDLVELRHFEEAVARMEAVRDVHVRRFGQGRAQIEVGMAGPYTLGRELQRLGRPMEIKPGRDGQVLVDFADVPEPESAPAEGTAGADPEPRLESDTEHDG